LSTTSPPRSDLVHSRLRGFEEFFSELASSLAAAGATRVTPTVAAEVIQPLWTKYGLAVSED
jgi:hypothetical protein